MLSIFCVLYEIFAFLFVVFLFVNFLLKLYMMCSGYPLLVAMEIIVFHSSFFDLSVMGKLNIKWQHLDTISTE